MKANEILAWLCCVDECELAELWRMADRVRLENLGSEVHLRGLIEISNVCRRRCGYCGISVANTNLERYRMSKDEILECVRAVAEYGYGTVVIQAGEDPGITGDWMSGLIRSIKNETDLAVTLSLGERSDDEFRSWKEAGADRYLLRFETSNRRLYDLIHPPLPGVVSDRVEMLGRLRDMGYEIGSGIMIGIPGQTYDDLVHDIEMFRFLDLDMIGVGPYIPHQATPLGSLGAVLPLAEDEQVPNSEEMTYKVIALTRLVCPMANIPSSTALATLNTASGRELGLRRGANIVMPNITPMKYRALYEIYPDKACLNETAAECCSCMSRRIQSIGRNVGRGRGDSPNRSRNSLGERWREGQ